jgi:demethylmenaquinone methyltransferase/2-methoxy-6-polyprenyl-1,4-benzoquinol methylase
VDLAAGTLDVSLEIRRHHPGLQVLALDFCLPMLECGMTKCRKKRATNLFPVMADARALPLPDASVDCVTMAFGIRNITPRNAAWAEMLRVLTPGGRACVLEFGGGNSRLWQGLYALYRRRLLPLIGRIVSGNNAYQYLADTIEAFPDAASLADEIRLAGFSQAFHLPLTSGIVCLHVAEKAA